MSLGIGERPLQGHKAQQREHAEALRGQIEEKKMARDREIEAERRSEREFFLPSEQRDGDPERRDRDIALTITLARKP